MAAFTARGDVLVGFVVEDVVVMACTLLGIVMTRRTSARSVKEELLLDFIILIGNESEKGELREQH